MTNATIDEAVADAVSKAEASKPVKTFRHRGLSASVFANPTKQSDRTFYSVAVQRAYKVDDEYRHSSSFMRDDVPVLKRLLTQAWEFILDEESKKKVADD